MSTLTDLTAEINTQLPTGVDRQITAAKVRTVLIDIAAKILSDQTLLGGGGGSADRYLTSNATAVPGDVCYCNTSNGGFTVTLPVTPTPGTGIGFRDAESSWAAANLTVFPGPNKIENTTGNLVCDVTNGNFDLVWSGLAEGWEIVPAISTGLISSLSGGGGGGGFYHISANQSVAAGNTYYCDTFGGSFTVTLPTGPAIGDGISFRDASGSWSLSNLILNPGSNPINNIVNSLVVDQSDINFDLIWRGTPIGWQVDVLVSDAIRGLSGVNRLRATQTFGALAQSLTATGAGISAITWNPSDKSGNITLSAGNLTATSTASGDSLARATVPGVAGRYFEVTFTAGTATNGIGLSTTSQSLSSYLGNPNGVGFFNSNYVEWPGSGTGNAMSAGWANGDVMGVLLDTSSVRLYKNGTLHYTVNTIPSGPLYPTVNFGGTGQAATANFGATTFAFLPSGATGWNGTQGSAPSGTTWNPSDNSGVTLSNGNLTATGSGTGGGQVRGTNSRGSGRYFEIHIDLGGTGGSTYVGLANISQVLTAGFAQDPNGMSYFNSGFVSWPGGSTSGPTFTTGDTMGIRLLSSSAEFYKNGTLVVTATGIPSGSLFPIVGVYNTGAAVTANFGATSFLNTPSGAVAWG